MEAPLNPPNAFAFADVPPGASPQPRRSARVWVVAGVIVVIFVTSGVLWATRTQPEVPATAAKVTIEVQGMHCPIQCPARARVAIESLSFVVPDSIGANTEQGRVWFLVTDPALLDRALVQAALEKRGFKVGEIVLSPRGAE